MICKKCGKRLPDSANFCDRCGFNLSRAAADSRSSAQRKKTTAGGGTAVATRTRAEKADSYESYRKKKMRHELENKRRRRKIRILIVWMVIIAIIGAVGGGIYSYTYMMSNIMSEDDTAVTQTAHATEQADDEQAEETKKPELTQETKKTDAVADSPDDNGCSVYIDRSYEFVCAYPSDFITGSLASNNTRLSLEDETGDGQMLINYEKISKSNTAANLMRDYVKGLGVDPDFNRAGDNWYSVTFTRSGRVNHRKAIIADDKYIYYDFSYEEGSDKASEYKDYIEFIDRYLEKEN